MVQTSGKQQLQQNSLSTFSNSGYQVKLCTRNCMITATNFLSPNEGMHDRELTMRDVKPLLDQ